MLRNKQYVVALPLFAAGDKSTRPAPTTERRKSLFIQNTGANSALLRFGGEIRRDGGDILLTAGTGIMWDQADTCPIEDINCQALAGATTLAVLEGVG